MKSWKPLSAVLFVLVVVTASTGPLTFGDQATAERQRISANSLGIRSFDSESLTVLHSPIVHTGKAAACPGDRVNFGNLLSVAETPIMPLLLVSVLGVGCMKRRRDPLRCRS
ncbi:MAG: hypothetical protein AB8G17_18375 [Gammaproteobacteria bacterium]